MRPQPRPRPGKYRTDAGPENSQGQRIRMTGRVATMSWCYRPGLLRESGVSVSCGWWPRTGPVKVAQLVAQLGYVPGLCQVLSVWLDCQKTGRFRGSAELPHDAVGSVSRTGDRWEHVRVIRSCKCILRLFQKKFWACLLRGHAHVLIIPRRIAAWVGRKAGGREAGGRRPGGSPASRTPPIP